MDLDLAFALAIETGRLELIHHGPAIVPSAGVRIELKQRGAASGSIRGHADPDVPIPVPAGRPPDAHPIRQRG